jgi:hypothetical protein
MRERMPTLAEVNLYVSNHFKNTASGLFLNLRGRMDAAVSGFALLPRSILGIMAMTFNFCPSYQLYSKASRTGNSKRQRPVFLLKKHAVVHIPSLRIPDHPYGTKSADSF